LLDTEESALRRHSEALEPDAFCIVATLNARFRLREKCCECRNGIDATLTMGAAP
jgi:hypothetical protein